MGLISKIEDKLHKDKGDSSTLQKDQYGDESSNSHLRHPVGSGTTSQGYDSSTTGGTHGSSGITGGSSTVPGSYGDSRTGDVGRDGYGHSSSGYGSSTTDPRDTTSGGGLASGPRDPYDPYSSKGQATAANAASGYPGDSSHGGSYANDPNVPRTREGGVMNTSSNPLSSRDDPYSSSASRGHHEPHSSGLTGSRQDPYTTSTQNSSGHPIRDAALGAGAGAGAAGAGYGPHSSHNNPQDPAHMDRSGGMGQPGMGSSGMDSSMNPSGGIGHTGGMGSAGGMGPSGGMGSTGGMGGGMIQGNDPKQQAASYEAGYRDAMEHVKQQMGRQ